MTSPGESQETSKRATLLDLAQSQENILFDDLQLSKKQREDKLAKIYQSILTLSPDPQVRTQVEYRLVQMDSEAYENIDFESLTQEQLDNKLSELVSKYKNLLTSYPNKTENEFIQYQLAKALDLQGRLDESLTVMESLLSHYPNSQFYAELNFRRGEIYYNLADYSAAFYAYQNVNNLKGDEKNSSKYQLNSLYMSGWALFKLDKLAEADIKFIQVIDLVIKNEKKEFYPDDFSFELLNSHQLNLVIDAQRILNISLSQQNQSQSLLSLINAQLANKQGHLYLYQHILFKNLADFLIEKELEHDAEQTYLAYINASKHKASIQRASNNGQQNSAYLSEIWSARFSIELLSLYKKQGKYKAIRSLKERYVLDYGLDSEMFLKAANYQRDELLPNLLLFSYQHSRSLYAKAQAIKKTQPRINAFKETALWLKEYLSIGNHPQAKVLLTEVTDSLLRDEFLFAEANFEAQEYQQALNSYQRIAYQTPIKQGSDLVSLSGKVAGEMKFRLEAAYAATITIQKIISKTSEDARTSKSNTRVNNDTDENYQALLIERTRLNTLFITTYPHDFRALDLAIFEAQFAFKSLDYSSVEYFNDFVLHRYKADSASVALNNKLPVLSAKGKKHVEIASQLQANALYKLANYEAAELSYILALRYVKKEQGIWSQMKTLLASCIYFQGQFFEKRYYQRKLETSSDNLALTNLLAEQAIENYLRIHSVSGHSTYAITGQFDAANLLLEQKSWQRAVEELTVFKKRYPSHEYSTSIPAKLAKSYEAMEQWELAANQLLLMINQPVVKPISDTVTPLSNENPTLLNPRFNREIQYTAAQYYVKAGNIPKAIVTYRTYAHTYPKPFDVAQEVRFKLSLFYQESNQINKQYFWYRKIISSHDDQIDKGAKQLTSNTLSRSTYLASISALGLGKAHQQAFKRAKLKSPLIKTLKVKQKAMKTAIRYYQKLLSYQLTDFVPNATFNLAEMYRQLAADVMFSERPSDLDELSLEEYEILLEEIAYPFEEKAIEIHASNAERSWQGIYDNWVAKSFEVLAELDPVQFNKHEKVNHAVSSIH